MSLDDLTRERNRIGTWGQLNFARLEVIVQYAHNKILDAGCASGEYVRHLVSKGYDAHGVDILPSEDWGGDSKDRFRRGDLQRLPYEDEEFETVLAFEVLEHIDDVDGVLRELRRVTAKNLIVSVPDAAVQPVLVESGLAYHHWVDRTHINFFTMDSLRKCIEAHGFRIEYQGRINPICPEKIVFDSLRFPRLVSRSFSRMLGIIPFRKNYYMTLILVACKAES